MEQLMNITIGEMLKKVAEKYPSREALVAPERRFRKTWQELDEICSSVAKGMLSMGIKKGDHVAIWATNYPEWVITQFATAKIGAVLVTVNTNYKAFELEYLLKQSDSTTLILSKGVTDDSYLNIIRQLCPTLDYSAPGQLVSDTFPFLKNIIYLGEETQYGMYNFSQLYDLAKNVSDDALEHIESTLDIHDAINMQYTSGTTGFPKGVMLTHHNISNNGKFIGDAMMLTNRDRLCIPVPLFHCFGCVLGVMACVSHASTMVLVDRFNPDVVMSTIDTENCTGVHGVPTMFISMLTHPNFDKYDFSTLRTGIMAGSPCPVEIMKQVIAKMNMTDVNITYGQTEASPGCTQTTTTDSLEKKVATVGRALPHTECKIVDPETNKDLPPGVQGEFVARGYNIMKGYYKMEEATKNAIDEDGWLHTGDLAVMDEDGFFKITGRLKDMIIRGGENIYPKELEELLYTHPQVQDVQVIGVPDERYGEVVMACIITVEDAILTEEEVKEFVSNNVARHKIPKYVDFMDRFPMTASGKIQKFKLRDAAIEKYNLQDAAKIETA